MSMVLTDDAAAPSTVQFVPLSKHIGCEVKGIDLRAPLPPATASAIYRAWLDHAVLLFRDQDLSQEDLIRVTGHFGEFAPLGRPARTLPKGFSRLLPNIMMISNIRENGETIGALPDGEMMFHHDTIHRDEPHKATLLYSVEIPTYGGDTLFASGTAAYDALDPALKAQLEGRRAVHYYVYNSVARCDKPEFVYTHVWRKGDLVVWDNRCSSHARTDFPADQRRLLLRTTVKGTSKPY